MNVKKLLHIGSGINLFGEYCSALHNSNHAENVLHIMYYIQLNCHIPWSQNGVVPLRLSGPPSQEGNLGYEPARDLPARAPEVIWV